MGKIKSVGVYETALKDGTPSYRASIKYNGKHISLGSYPDENTAAVAFKEARHILSDESFGISSYKSSNFLDNTHFIGFLPFIVSLIHSIHVFS